MTPALTDPHPTCLTNFCLSISLHTGLSIPQKQPCCQSTTTLSAQWTTARYHFSFCWTLARLSTLWTTRYFCQCYPTVFLWTLQLQTGLSHTWPTKLNFFTHDGRQTSSFQVDCSAPQGSVFGTVGFIISYIEDVVDLTDRCGVWSHMYVVAPVTSTCFHLDTNLWCRSRHLQLNANKTEAIWSSQTSPSWVRPICLFKSDLR